MKKIFLLSVSALAIVACNKTDQKFRIANDSVGLLHKDIRVQQLDSLFVNDSIVNSSFEGELRYASNERITIFEKGGKPLLELTPKVNTDNEKVIESVLIKDGRYTFPNGISLASTFKDIKNKYANLDFQVTLSSVVVSPQDENYYFTFDKSALKNTRLGLSSEVTTNDISDDAPLSRITINWD